MRHNQVTRKPNRLVRLMIANWALGWAVGLVCAIALLVSNVAGFRDILFHSELMWQGLALLIGGFGVTFGSVVCATAIMLLPAEEETDHDRGGMAMPVLLPAYVMARARSSRG
jgi:hypothetical protein